MRVLKHKPTRRMPPQFTEDAPWPRRVNLARCSLRQLEMASEWDVLERVKRRWRGMAPITGIGDTALRKQGFERHLSAPAAAEKGIRVLPMHPADACFHLPEMVAGLEWRLRHLIEHPVQVRLIDGVRVMLILGSLLVIKWPSGQLATFAWQGDPTRDTELSMFRMSTDKVALQGTPWRWMWLGRLMQGFVIELRVELVKQGRMTDSELNVLPQAFEGYLQDLSKVMRHRLSALPAYRVMRQRIAAALDLDPVALALAHRISDAPAHLGHDLTMVSSYNRAVQHRELLLQVQAEAPRLLTFYAGMLEDEAFPREGEPLERLRNCLHHDLGTHGPYRMLLKTDPRQFVLMRHFIANLQHENYQDWLYLLHKLSPFKPIPAWLLRILVSQYGNERQRVHLYARRFQPSMPLWTYLVKHWVDVEHPSEADLAEIGQVALWIVDGPDRHLDRRQRQQGWAGLVERAGAWLAEQLRERNQAPLALASRIRTRTWEDWTLVPLTTDHALWQEGTLMGHCLGRNNGPKAGRTTWFGSLQHLGKRVLTCHFETANGRHRLVTALGRFNARPTPEERRVLSQLLKHGVNVNANTGTEQGGAMRSVRRVGDPANMAANESTVSPGDLSWDVEPNQEDVRHAA